ncbi:MAG: GtrA family protein [Pseudomonadota bacterium]
MPLPSYNEMHRLLSQSHIVSQASRYVINGLLATLAHYGAFATLVFVIGFTSAALANSVGALFGIAVSFLGNRYFVFRSTGYSWHQQCARFSFVYLALGALHVIIVWLLADRYGLDKTLAFATATAVQAISSFSINKFWVFKHEK